MQATRAEKIYCRPSLFEAGCAWWGRGGGNRRPREDANPAGHRRLFLTLHITCFASQTNYSSVALCTAFHVLSFGALTRVYQGGISPVDREQLESEYLGGMARMRLRERVYHGQ